MIRHWLLLAWRTVRGEPVFAAISVLSLVIGCSGAVLVGSYLHQELTTDHWMPEAARIVRLDARVTFPGQEPVAMAMSPSGVGRMLIDQLPGLEAGARFTVTGVPLRRGEVRVQFAGYFADPSFFDVVPLPLEEGDWATALDDPSGVVLSAATKAILFGDEPALGETVSIGDHEAVVTGVAARLLFNSAFRNLPVIARLDAPFRPPSSDPRSFDEIFDNPNAAVFLRADSPKTAREWLETLPQLARDIQAANAELPEGMSFVFEPIMLRAIYLAGPKLNGGTTANRTRLALFATVAAALLFVSAFNYVSLSLARVVRRTREVGLRKAMGATRGDLTRQHLAESAVLTVIAVALGYVFAVFAQPWFARTLRLEMVEHALLNWRFIVAAIVGAAVLAVLVAAYPAAFLSRVRPASILQGRSGQSRGLSAAIFALVAIQFVAATALVSAVAVFYAQARFVASTPLGYEAEGRYVMIAGGYSVGPSVSDEAAEANAARLSRVRASLAGAPGVISVSGSGLPTFLNLNPGSNIESIMAQVVLPGQMEEEAGKAFIDLVDLEYFETMGIRTIAGRGFDARLGSDRILLDNPTAKPAQLPAVITREALRVVGARTPEEALGSRARVALPFDQGGYDIEVVGVTEDFHWRSLRFPVDPVVFVPNPGGASALYARVDPAQRETAVAALQAAMEEASTGPGVQVQIIDHEEIFENMYAEERGWRRIVTWVAVLAALVACLGLYGLTAFSAGQRRLEVGVRKSLGADDGDILRLMTMRFVRPVLVGIVIGWVIAWVAMAEWLQGYAHHVPLTPVPFLLAGAGALLVALATVLAHALHAARLSPAVVLRTE